MDYVLLGVITASVVGIAIFTFIKFMRKKVKKYTLRYDRIKKYFDEERE